MPRRCALVLTDDDLHAAWLQRRRPSWPATYAEVMADPLLSALVRACALGRAQALARDEQRHGPMPSGPQYATRPAPTAATTTASRPVPVPVPALLRRAGPAPFDPKRLAAGDRDDDD